MYVQKSAYVDTNPVIIKPNHKIILAKRKIGITGGGKWHLPGGRVLFRETLVETLKRVSFVKTNLRVDIFYPSLKESLVGIYDDPNRDPREHVISIAFFCKIINGDIIPGTKVDEVNSFSEMEIKDLDIAFDHRKTLDDAFVILKDRGSAMKSQT
ncbi:MAG: NUDIX domain-containing protein [Candidatus Bathyarchaeota archaeon]